MSPTGVVCLPFNAFEIHQDFANICHKFELEISTGSCQVVIVYKYIELIGRTVRGWVAGRKESRSGSGGSGALADAVVSKGHRRGGNSRRDDAATRRDRYIGASLATIIIQGVGCGSGRIGAEIPSAV